MKDEKEINVAIAEACGWKIDWPDNWRERVITPPSGRSFKPTDPRVGLDMSIPNYCADLNAMHQAEKIFNNANLCDSFVRYLCCIIDIPMPFEASPLYVWMSIVHATARQRAEAFLRTIGKWSESVTAKKPEGRFL